MNHLWVKAITPNSLNRDRNTSFERLLNSLSKNVIILKFIVKIHIEKELSD